MPENTEWILRVVDAVNAYGRDRAPSVLGVDRNIVDRAIRDYEISGVSSENIGDLQDYLARSNYADLIGTREGDEYYIRYYSYLEGQNVDTEQEGRRFQAILYGRDADGNERKFTTSMGGTVEDVMGMAEYMMTGYKGASIGLVVIGVFDTA